MMFAIRRTITASSSTSLRQLSTSRTLLAPNASPLEAALRDGLKTAMKSKDRPAATCIKTVLADVTNVAKSSPDPSAPATQENVLTTIRKAIAQRTQAAESYAPSSPSAHPENHSALITEIQLLKSYLPESPSSESIQGTIRETIDALEQSVREGKGVTGAVMKELQKKMGDTWNVIDRKEVGKWVAEALKR